MRSVVIQSYKTAGVAPWIGRCLSSVRDWAASAGHQYLFEGDTFLDRVPADYRHTAGRHITVITDLARLLWSRDLLAGGEYDRVIWVDADLLVFDPANFSIEGPSDFAFCREVWGMPTAAAVGETPKVRFDRRVNNAVSVFDRGNAFLDFYIAACRVLVASRRPTEMGPLVVGTAFLTGLHRILPLPLLQNVGTLSPVLVAELAEVTMPLLAPRVDPPRGLLAAYVKTQGHSIAAANLCGSLAGSAAGGAPSSMPEAVMLAVVERLLASKGESINRCLQSLGTGPHRAPS